MVARKAKGFTLVELLVVIAIIALLVSILLPSLNRAKEMAKRASCSANVRSIQQAMVMYSNYRNSGLMPHFPVPSAATNKWDWPIGARRMFDVNTLLPRPMSSNFWLLISTGFASVDIFVCPSTEDTPDPIKGNDGANAASAGDDETSVTDFLPHTDSASEGKKHLSYGIQNPYGESGSLSSSAESGVAWIADSSPYVYQVPDSRTGQIDGSATADLVDWTDTGTNLDWKKEHGNSPNHLGDGQNVAYSDGSVAFHSTSNCGLDKDNIYTAAGGNNETSEGGTCASDSVNCAVDSFILP